MKSYNDLIKTKKDKKNQIFQTTKIRATLIDELEKRMDILSDRVNNIFEMVTFLTKKGDSNEKL